MKYIINASLNFLFWVVSENGWHDTSCYYDVTAVVLKLSPSCFLLSKMEHNEKTQILKDVDSNVDDTRDKSTVRMIHSVEKSFI